MSPLIEQAKLANISLARTVISKTAKSDWLLYFLVFLFRERVRASERGFHSENMRSKENSYLMAEKN